MSKRRRACHCRRQSRLYTDSCHHGDRFKYKLCSTWSCEERFGIFSRKEGAKQEEQRKSERLGTQNKKLPTEISDIKGVHHPSQQFFFLYILMFIFVL